MWSSENCLLREMLSVSLSLQGSPFLSEAVAQLGKTQEALPSSSCHLGNFSSLQALSFSWGTSAGRRGGGGGEGGSGTYPESGQTFSHHFGRTLMPTSHWIVFALGVLHPPKDLGLGWLQLFSGTVVGLLTGCGPHRHATSLPPLLRVPANQCFP